MTRLTHTLPRKDQTRAAPLLRARLRPFPGLPQLCPPPWDQQPPETLLKALGVSCHLPRTCTRTRLPIPGGRGPPRPQAQSTGPQFPVIPAPLRHQPPCAPDWPDFWLLAGGHLPLKGLLKPNFLSVLPALLPAEPPSSSGAVFSFCSPRALPPAGGSWA